MALRVLPKYDPYPAAFEAEIVRWDVTFGTPFKTGKRRAEELLQTGGVKLRKDGALDMRYRKGRFVARYFPEMAR